MLHLAGSIHKAKPSANGLTWWHVPRWRKQERQSTQRRWLVMCLALPSVTGQRVTGASLHVTGAFLPVTGAFLRVTGALHVTGGCPARDCSFLACDWGFLACDWGFLACVLGLLACVLGFLACLLDRLDSSCQAVTQSGCLCVRLVFCLFGDTRSGMALPHLWHISSSQES